MAPPADSGHNLDDSSGTNAGGDKRYHPEQGIQNMTGDVIGVNQGRTAMKQFPNSVKGNRDSHVRSIYQHT